MSSKGHRFSVIRRICTGNLVYSTVTMVNNNVDLKFLEKQTSSTPGIFHSLGYHDWFKHKTLTFFEISVQYKVIVFSTRRTG